MGGHGSTGSPFFFVVVGAWFAIVFTGRWPAGMYDFAAGFLRYVGRVQAYCYLIVRRVPALRRRRAPRVPGADRRRAAQGAAQPRQDVLSDRPRDPVYCIQYVFSIWLFVVAVAIWFVAVITGRTGPSLTDAQRMPMAYYIRANAYFYLITEDWPPFDPGPSAAPSGQGSEGAVQAAA